jgi:hypothetical protein
LALRIQTEINLFSLLIRTLSFDVRAQALFLKFNFLAGFLSSISNSIFAQFEKNSKKVDERKLRFYESLRGYGLQDRTPNTTLRSHPDETVNLTVKLKFRIHSIHIRTPLTQKKWPAARS